MAKVNTNKAFSILEMAVSISIIGLLMAAIVAGQKVKHRMELTQIITDIGATTSAFKQFKEIYGNNIPGDYFDARRMFGAMTDNGNGNGYLDTALTNGNTAPICSTPYNETLLFWQHLQLAGLISGTYDCKTLGAGGAMASKIKYGFYFASKALNVPTVAINPKGRINIRISKPNGEGVLTTKDASDIDNKYDDGNPTSPSGIIFATDDAVNPGGCLAAGTYKTLTHDGTPCVLYFYLE